MVRLLALAGLAVIGWWATRREFRAPEAPSDEPTFSERLFGESFEPFTVGPNVDVKGGVSFVNIQGPAVRAMGVAAVVWSRWGRRLTITRGTEGPDRIVGPGDPVLSAGESKHDAGLAFDGRIRDVEPRTALAPMLSDLRAELGPEYDVILESDHFHVEYDPKAVT